MSALHVLPGVSGAWAYRGALCSTFTTALGLPAEQAKPGVRVKTALIPLNHLLMATPRPCSRR